MDYKELLAVADKLPKYYEYEDKSSFDENDKSSFGENDECCICLEKDKLWKTCCNHIVCKICIPLMKNKICPMCRKNLQKEINKPTNLIEYPDMIYPFSEPTNFLLVDSNEYRVGR